MKTFAEWFKENYNEELPTGSINGSWFADHGLPMIVECSCCTTTMALPSAVIDDEGYVFCSTCGGEHK